MAPKNLLVIMADEHNPKMLGCAGHPLVKTPHLDALAKRGTRFNRACTNCPICVPARASFASGRYVHDIGYWDNAIAYDGRIKSRGHRLQEAGIRVESIGKLHYRREEDPMGFDRQHLPMHIKDDIGMIHSRSANISRISHRHRRNPAAEPPVSCWTPARGRANTHATIARSRNWRAIGCLTGRILKNLGRSLSVS